MFKSLKDFHLVPSFACKVNIYYCQRGTLADKHAPAWPMKCIFST